MFLGTELETWLRIGLLLITSSMIGLCWFGWWITRQSGIVYCLVGAHLFSIAQVVLVVSVLGLLGILFPELLILVNMAVSALVYWIGVRPGREKIRPFLSRMWNTLRESRNSKVVIVLLVIWIAISGWNLFWGWFLPSREWDSLNYHLPMVAAFVQSHAIFPLQSPVPWMRFYPFNGELIEIWTLSVVGVEKIVDWVFFPTIVAGAFAIYGVCRSLGAKPEASALGAAVMAFAPRVLLQQAEAMPDALLVSTIAMGLFMILGVPNDPDEDRSRMRLSAIGAAAAAGLVAGIKFAGIVYALGLCFLFWLRWIHPVRKSHSASVPTPKPAEWVRIIAPAAVLFVSLCAYPYARNLILNGNPVYPYIVQVDGVVLLPGIRDLSEFQESNTVKQVQSMGVIARTAYPWFEPYQSIHDNYLGGLGPLWIVVGVPALLAWIIRALRRREAVQIAIIFMLAVGIAVTPAFWYPRYSLPLIILGSLAAATVLDGLGRWPRRIIAAEIVFLSMFSAFNTLAPKSVSWTDARMVLLEQDDRTRSGAQFVHPDFGRAAYEWIEINTLDQPAAIAYGENVYFPYLLYGTDLRNRVIHLLAESETDWIAGLDQSKADLVLVRSDMPTYAWIVDCAKYQEVFQEGGYVVFKRIP